MSTSSSAAGSGITIISTMPMIASGTITSDLRDSVFVAASSLTHDDYARAVPGLFPERCTGL
jgi:hypothetical protein